MGFLLDDVGQMLAHEEPFEKIEAALDDLRTRPDIGGERGLAAIERYRITVYCVYKRSATECAAVLDHYLAMERQMEQRGEAIWLTCASFPELRPRYLPAMIAELEQALPSAARRDLLERLHEVQRRPVATTAP